MSGNKFTVKISINYSLVRRDPFTYASVFIILMNRWGNYRKSSILRYSYSTAKISKHGKTNKHVSLNVNTLSIDSKSKINNSLSFKVEKIDGLPSLSVSANLTNAYNNDCLGVKVPKEFELSSSSLLLSSFNSFLLSFFTSIFCSLSKCFLINSSIAWSSSSSSTFLSVNALYGLLDSVDSLLLDLNFSALWVFISGLAVIFED